MATIEMISKTMDYVKADPSDISLEAILDAAIEKCEEETGKAFDESSALYCIAVMMLAADWYDHRGTTTTENLKDMPESIHVQRILNQISLNSDYAGVSE